MNVCFFSVEFMSLCLYFLIFFSFFLGGCRACSSQAAGLSCISVASVILSTGASLLIWGKISPADGSLLKHRKRSELIPACISPVISQLSDPLLPTLLSHFSSRVVDFPQNHRAWSIFNGVNVSFKPTQTAFTARNGNPNKTWNLFFKKNAILF